MWLDEAKSAIVDNAGWWHLLAEEKVQFSASRLFGIRPMNCIFSTVCTENSSNRIWRLLFGNSRISWSNEFSPSFNCTCLNKLHTNADIAGHERLKSWEEWLFNMLSIEFSSCIIIEFWHFKLTNLESSALNTINNFTKILILIWLNHCEGRFPLSALLSSSSNISIFFNSKNSRENGNFSSDK